MTAVVDAVHRARAADLCVMPPRQDGTKAPAVAWRTYQSKPPTDAEIARWYRSDRTGIGILTGAVSGGLEMLEFEGRAVLDGSAELFADLAKASGLGDVLDRIVEGYTEVTPSGGYHLLYRVAHPRANTLLASRPATAEELTSDPSTRSRVMIETRGEGGYVIIAPSHGMVHPTGRSWDLFLGSLDTIDTISDAERDALFALAQGLDRMPVRLAREPSQGSRMGALGDRPGDRYNAAHDADGHMIALLEAHGWTVAYQRGSTTFLCRPGKESGVSATVGHHPGVFYVFSTSTAFEAGRGHTPFFVYATLGTVM